MQLSAQNAGPNKNPHKSGSGREATLVATTSDEPGGCHYHEQAAPGATDPIKDHRHRAGRLREWTQRDQNRAVGGVGGSEGRQEMERVVT